ncbi:transporter substrate-binding domain-containing protein [Shinella sp. 838]|uniref:transporter substrate-binding domain-containing protein n=1 Tax=Shinella sp. 838 TaxID=3038164 RepID=UPI00241522CF|nr:transporter substrate-binding domain-containing protein [Shinella sp. 838]MDG4674807.1 transporter substrate-binding domain-containing protein [Shinella sp. 838]
MNMKTISKLSLVAGVALMAFAGVVRADGLENIKKAGKVRIAVAMGIPQYSFVDGDLKATGSDVETARLIAKDLGVELELVEITNAARVPTVQTGKADMVVSALGITEERKKAIDYSVPYATLSIIVAAPASIEIKGYDDLAGKTIGVTRATTNDQDITAKASGANIRRFEDDATLITSVVSGQIDIISSQSAVIGGINARRSGEPIETKFTQAETNLGIGIAKGEANLKTWLDDWVKTNFENGTIRKVFTQFHNRELPDDLTSR